MRHEARALRRIEHHGLLAGTVNFASNRRAIAHAPLYRWRMGDLI